ncbi:unnamed protein product [Acidithrix sp. C25]|nr:unnamed protein product [Acidithrix sp. C25]
MDQFVPQQMQLANGSALKFFEYDWRLTWLQLNAIKLSPKATSANQSLCQHLNPTRIFDSATGQDPQNTTHISLVTIIDTPRP